MIITEQLLGSETTEWYKVPDDCFYCMKKLIETPCIMWNGGDHQIWLHPQCAIKLGSILIKEGNEACE